MANVNVAPEDNPLTLHQNENPAAVLVTAILTEGGENYHSWSRSMVRSLKMKNKERFIDGTLPKPDVADPTFRAWDRCNTTVLSWIFHALDPQIAESVQWMGTALEVWTDLKRRYYHGDVFRIAELHEEIYAARQGDLSITAYFTRLKSMWEELFNFCPIPSCTCDVKCTCELIPTMQKYRENEIVIRFLKGLSEQYAAVRSQIMLMKPLPCVADAFSLLVQQERQFNSGSDDSKLVCKLEKSLYGLKQASRQWNAKLSHALIESGYIQSKSDYSLFTKNSTNGFTCILVYVDDLVLAGDDLEEIKFVKNHLDSLFSIKDLGTLKFFLGFEVARSKEGITLYQRKYALDLLKDTGLLAAKPCSTPMDHHLKLQKDSGEALQDITAYRRLVGRLLYLTHTRPDICFAVSQLSQFLDCPTSVHYAAAIRVVRYIKGAPAAGLLFSADSDLKIKGFSDSDWGTCPDTRRSITGYCFFLGTSLVSWKSKKQATVSKSSSEAEYRALAQATCEAQWLIYLLQDFQIADPKPAVIYCDNQSALHIAANPVFHERTKHIELDCHIVREKLQHGTLHLLPISSKLQLADILTKPLAAGPFHSIHSKLGMLNIHIPS